MSSIFTKIIDGAIPSHKVHEDDKTFAFLDISPLSDGHTLVVPKTEVARVEDLQPDDAAALWASVQKVAKRLREVYDPTRVCIKVEGFDVAHVHVHVFTCQNPDDFYKRASHNAQPDHQVLAQIAQQLYF